MISLRPSLDFILITRISQWMIRIDKMVRRIISDPKYSRARFKALFETYERPCTLEQGFRFPYPYVVRLM